MEKVIAGWFKYLSFIFYRLNLLMYIYFYVQSKNVSKTNTKRQKQQHKNLKPIIVKKKQ